MKKDVQQQIEQTLNSLHGVQRAEANPFLFTKIKYRMRRQHAEPVLPGQWSLRLALVMVTVVLMNAFTIENLLKNKLDETDVAAVAAEYSISLPEAY